MFWQGEMEMENDFYGKKMKLVKGRYSQDRVEWFLAAVALALLDLDGLRRWLDLDPIEVQMEAANLLEALGCLDKVRLSLQLSVARDLRKSTKQHESVAWATAPLICAALTWKWFFFWHTNASSAFEKLKPLSASTL
jgi:hypothetical protein